ncbi:hypothetical protein BS47DRAFT_1375316 [Hydnum rufescens UP504]|uniref:60S ribosomal protein L6 n=1 Tax=Hydnum rufescens UP504 TaxID=1448309 RepID=A0A9P6B601_9AGAM|nr:hypothetical protein BS47DRAFT_1375316 [Hydnum rufescens UP504]
MVRTTIKPHQTRRGFRATGSSPIAVDVSPKEVKVGGEKNGGTQNHPRSTLRPSITPGTILILLAGRFRGKRVVFLKQLESGLLLITGPYKVNGVPLRRVNQAYVIATSTKIEVDTQIAEKFTDAYFAKEAASVKQSAEAEFFEEGKPKVKAAFPESKAADQKQVDKAVLEVVKAKENLAKYLKASWGLSKGQFPHQIVF